MAKISELPELVDPTGHETVVVLAEGETRQSPLDRLVDAAVRPIVEDGKAATRDTRAVTKAYRRFDGAGEKPLFSVGGRYVLSMDAINSEPRWMGRRWPVPATGPVRQAVSTIREYTGSGAIPLVTMAGREVISIDRETNKPLWMGGLWPGGDGGSAPSRRMPFVLIVPYNASAAIKALADYVCTGTDDDLVIQAAIDALPANGVVYDGADHATTGGVRGHIFLAAGIFLTSKLLRVPAGSCVCIEGTSPTPWIPIGPAGITEYPGGTIIYSTDASGGVLHFPKNSYGQPATGIVMRNLEFRVRNPAANTGGIALNLDGWITGHIENINVLADLTVGGAQRVGTGISINAGAASSRKFMAAVNAYNFRVEGIRIDTTHLTALNISAGNIAGDAYSMGIKVTPADDLYLAGLQTFGVKYGLSVSNNSALQVVIESLHCETTDYPCLIDSTRPVFIRTLNIDKGVQYRGDVVTKVVVDTLVAKDNPTKLAQFFTKVIVPAGQTSVSVAHRLIGAPRLRTATPQSDPGGRHWLAADATNLTLTLSSAPPADVAFDVFARI
jgi:hypothetical protein